jgi:hypothetical protein
VSAGSAAAPPGGRLAGATALGWACSGHDRRTRPRRGGPPRARDVPARRRQAVDTASLRPRPHGAGAARAAPRADGSRGRTRRAGAPRRWTAAPHTTSAPCRADGPALDRRRDAPSGSTAPAAAATGNMTGLYLVSAPYPA